MKHKFPKKVFRANIYFVLPNGFNGTWRDALRLAMSECRRHPGRWDEERNVPARNRARRWILRFMNNIKTGKKIFIAEGCWIRGRTGYVECRELPNGKFKWSRKQQVDV